MRRKDREVTDPKIIDDIINSCDVIRLAMTDGDQIYIVPLNYGYQRVGEDMFFYLHSAHEGRKIDMLRKNPRVCFEMDTDHEHVKNEIACKNTFHYKSIIGYGEVEFIENMGEKGNALDCIMNSLIKDRNGEVKYDYNEEAVKRVCVFKLKVTDISGKVSQ